MPSFPAAPGWREVLLPDPRLDVVPVGIQHERRVPVVLAHSWGAIVLAAGLQRGRVERVDGRGRVREERHVGGSADLALRDPEVVAAILHETEGIAVLAVDAVAQRRQGLLVELPALAGVAAAEADVLDHDQRVPRARAVRKPWTAQVEEATGWGAGAAPERRRSTAW